MKKNRVIASACILVAVIAIIVYIATSNPQNSVTPPVSSAGTNTPVNTGSSPAPSGDRPAAPSASPASPNNTVAPANPQTSPQTGSALSAKDFAITDGKELILLDMPFKGFSTSSETAMTSDPYDGDLTIGNVTYTYYSYKYKAFNLQTSNVNYNLKGRKQDDQYICMLYIRDPKFTTPRGVTINTDMAQVIEAYGEGKKTFRNDKPCLLYQFKDMELAFVFEGPNVQTVTMKILAGVQAK